jgi:hypothetical protein
MRVLAGCILLIAGMPAFCLAVGPPTARTVPAPVRLPAVTSAAAVAPTPLLQPIAMRDFESFEPTPLFELDLGLPMAPRTTVGGWIAVGYHSGALGQ